MKKKKLPYGEECPKCGEKWKITVFNVQIWYDCLKCGENAEDIIKKDPKKPKKPYSNDTSWDLVVDHGFMYAGDDDDSEDDWF